jgi:predicted nuclease of predicted toxin-antitoxin system
MSKKSKKPSGTKAERLLEETTFYVDDCLGKGVAQALRANGWKVEWHRDHFDRDAVLDIEIFEFLAPRRWVMLTKDKGLRKNAHEVEKIVECNCRVFSLSNATMNSEQMSNVFLSNARSIGRFLKNCPAPFVAYLQKDRIDLLDAMVERIAKATSDQTES